MSTDGAQGRVGATGIQWVEARDSARHPTIHSTGPTVEIIQPQISVVFRFWNQREGLEVGVHLRR